MTDATANSHSMSRRTFLKAGATVGSLAALAAAAASAATAHPEFAYADVDPVHSRDEYDTVWSQCNVNCGGRCVFRWHVREGRIEYLTTDDTAAVYFQSRACVRGRAMRQWVNHPDRLYYPMKRTGARGEGKFERISWDEAIDTIVDKLRYTIETYGNDAI